MIKKFLQKYHVIKLLKNNFLYKYFFRQWNWTIKMCILCFYHSKTLGPMTNNQKKENRKVQIWHIGRSTFLLYFYKKSQMKEKKNMDVYHQCFILFLCEIWNSWQLGFIDGRVYGIIGTLHCPLSLHFLWWVMNLQGSVAHVLLLTLFRIMTINLYEHCDRDISNTD